MKGGMREYCRNFFIIEEIIAEKFPNLVKGTNPDLWNWANPTQDKLKEIYANKYHNKIFKSRRQRKTLKACRDKWCFPYRRTQFGMTVDFFSEIMKAERK